MMGVQIGGGMWTISNAEFRRMWCDPAMSVAAIARRAGVSRQAVYWQARARGMPPRPSRRARLMVGVDADLFRCLWMADFDLRAIRGEFGIGYLRAVRIAAALRLPPRSIGPGRSLQAAALPEFKLARRMAAAHPVRVGFRGQG